MTTFHCRTTWLALVAAAVACSPDGAATPVTPRAASLSANSGAAHPYSYIIIGNRSDGLPSTLQADVQAAGGTLTSTLPQIGLAVVESDRADFADFATLAGIEAVVWTFRSPRWMAERRAPGSSPSRSETRRLRSWRALLRSRLAETRSRDFSGRSRPSTRQRRGRSATADEACAWPCSMPGSRPRTPTSLRTSTRR